MEKGLEAVDEIKLAQDVDSCEHGNEHLGVIKCGNYLTS
jgi:hypothetical protein